MSNKIQSVRGMNDILPDTIHHWQRLEKTFANLLDSYGFSEIRTPIVESTALFKRSIGEVTDIVEKEMYTFADRNSDSLSLRPENTASIVRAIIEHGLLQTRQKLWYQGPMFRHERPQKGRYRQFHQLGCEAFGMQGPGIDAEVIAIGCRLWRTLGLKNIELQINSLGTIEARNTYKTVLVKFLSLHKDILDDDSLRRLDTNPLRILDSKNQDVQNLLKDAPDLSEYLDDESTEHFAGLCELLDSVNIKYTINPQLVRGLDYYGKTVFEWVSTELGAQGTICAGGRYDGMVEHIGGKQPTPGVGFALGIERILDLLQQQELELTKAPPDIYLVLVGDKAQIAGIQLVEKLHDARSDISIISNHDGGSFKSQFKRADKSGARYALILGEDELEKQVVGIKNLIDNVQQEAIALDTIHDWIKTV